METRDRWEMICVWLFQDRDEKLSQKGSMPSWSPLAPGGISGHSELFSLAYMAFLEAKLLAFHGGVVPLETNVWNKTKQNLLLWETCTVSLSRVNCWSYIKFWSEAEFRDWQIFGGIKDRPVKAGCWLTLGTQAFALSCLWLAGCP